MRVERCLRFCAAGIIAFAAVVAGYGYTLIRDSSGVPIKWPAGAIAMQVKLPTSPALTDGTNFSTSVVAAMQAWNTQVGAVQFAPQQLGPGAYATGNSVNEVVMDSTIDGDAFDDNTLAVTLSYRSGNTTVEADLIFNTAWSWDSYRGTLRPYGHGAGYEVDIRRVAIHELGHVLGLDHPDQAMQSVNAIMNSVVSDTDTFQADDIAGAQFLYGPASGSPARPGNDNFANATVITGNSATVTGTNVLASKEPGEPNHAGNAGGDSVWWKWTAPDNGTVGLTTAGSGFDTLLAVYAGSAVSALTPIAANDDVNSSTLTSAVTLNVTAGTTYYIAVDGWGGDASSISLGLSFTAGGVAPYIISHPQSVTALHGGSVSFTASAGGDPAPAHQWQVSMDGGVNWQVVTNTAPYSGAFTTTLTISPVSFFMSGYQYRCRFFGFPDTGTGATTNAATLTVNAPPLIFGSLSDQLIPLGGTATFALSIVGSTPFTYQWQHNNADIPGATSSSLVLNNAQQADAGSYRVVVTNAFGSVTTSPATLTLFGPPVITAQPQNSYAQPGATVSFGVTATSGAPATYQWYRNGAVMAGATSSFIIISNAQPADFTTYHVVVTNAAGFIVSDDASLILSSPPVITTHPIGQTVTVGDAVTLTAAASGAPPPTYQWRRNGVDISGATSATYTIPHASLGDSGAYRVVATNTVGTATSNVAILTVIPPGPTITSLSPTRQVLSPGASLSLNVTATGVGSLTYQWTRNGRAILGATGSNYAVAGVTFDTAGWYLVYVTDSIGTRRSAPIFVAVVPNGTPIPPRQLRGMTYYNDSAPALTDVVSIASGFAHSLALRSNGTVYAWGTNDAGQATVPAGLTGVIAIAAGGNGSLALKSDGTVVAWGASDNGVLNIPAGLSNVVAVSTSGSHSLALRSDGTVVAWGYNYSGQATVPDEVADVVAISAHSSYSLALKSDGTVVAWGTLPSSTAPVPAGLSNVVAIAVGDTHALALKDDGTVVEWGYYQNEFVTVRPKPAGLAGVVAIAAGSQTSLAVKSDGSVVAWGAFIDEQLAGLAALEKVLAVSMGSSLYVALRDASADTAPVVTIQPLSQTLQETQTATWTATVTGAGPWAYQWRKGGVNIPGATSAVLTRPNLTVTDAGSYDVVVTNYIGSTTSAPATLTVIALPPITNLSPVRQIVAPGQTLDLNITATGVGSLSYQWMHNGRAINGATAAHYSTANATIRDNGWYYVLVTDSNGTRRSATFFVRVAPAITQVRIIGTYPPQQLDMPAGLNDVVEVSAGESHVLALRANGTVVAWGSDNEGQSDVPADLSNVVDVSAGLDRSLALKSDGTVVAWGGSVNTPPAGLSEVVAISAGRYHSLVLKADGTVVAWGASNNGVLDVPVGLSGVVDIAAGYDYSLALKNDGTAVVWGQNQYNNIRLPAGLSNLVGMTSSISETIATKQDGSIIGWAYDAYGTYNIPAGLTNARAIAAGNPSIAIKQDGTLIAWVGFGGSITPYPTPPDIDKAFAVAARYAQFVIRDATGDITPVISTQPVSQVLVESQSAVLSVQASGGGPYSYQWRKNGSNISGATNPVLAFANVAFSDAGNYDVIVTNPYGSTTSAVAVLTVNSAPVISGLATQHQLLAPGQSLNLGVTATGTGTLSYQWSLNGQPIAAATGSTYSVASVGPQDRGWYTVAVTDSHGTRYSSPITVKIIPAVTQVVTWGSNLNGQNVVPPNLTNVVSLDTSYQHILALKRDGTVVAWGINDNGQRNVPAGLSGVVEVAAGSQHSLALKDDGTVVAWGISSSAITNVPAGLTDAIAIDAGGDHSLALKRDGTVVAWGGNGSGQITVPANLYNVVGVAAGAGFSLALKRDGTVVGWGNTTVPAGLSNVTAISASSGHAVVLKSDGTVVAWGADSNGQADVPAGLAQVAGVAAAWDSSVVVKNNGAIVAWGANSNSYSPAPANITGGLQVAGGWLFWLALIDPNPAIAPAITTHPQTQTVFAGINAAFTVTASGTAPLSYQWRKGGVNLSNTGSISGATTATLTITSAQAGDAGSYDVVVTNTAGSATSNAATLTVAPPPPPITARPSSQRVTVGGSATLSITATGAASYSWKHNGVPIAGATTNTLSIPTVALGDRGLYEVLATNANGSSRSLAYLNVTGTNTVSAWGDNSFGQTTVPGGLANLAQISSGVYHTLALKGDGTVAAWGSNANGQSSVPGGLANVVAVSAGRLHSVALKSDGTVVAWGDNSAGQCTVPGGLNNVVWISAGGMHTTALKNDGTIVTWGDNTYGQCTVPAGLSATVVGLSAGLSHTLALKNDGTVVAWGRNDFGQTTISGGLGNVVGVEAGASHNLAIKSDGTVVAWGRNDSNQTVVPAGLANVVQVDSLGNHTLAVKTDGSVVAWGNNASGQTVVPAGLGPVQQVAAGALHSVVLVIVVPQPPSITNSSPARNVVTPGQNLTLGVTATGTGPISYQWIRNGRPINGATGSSLNITGATYQDSGYYLVLATNPNGTSRSRAMFVRVAPTVTKPVVWGYSGSELVPPSDLSDAVTVTSASVQALAIKRNGTVTAWGASSNLLTVPAGLAGVVDLSAGSDHVAALKDDGTVVVWGSNYQGKATVPAGLADVVAISAGGDHVLALRGNGTVVAWGDNTSGQCNVPAGLTGVVAVAAGGKHSLAMKQDGSVVAWGYNLFGQATIPGGVTNVFAIDAGSTHSMAINFDGIVSAWGDNTSGQCNVPGGLSGVISLSSLSLHSLALLNDGTVRAWGYGGVGYGLITVPAGLGNVIAVSAGGNFSMALRDATGDIPPAISVRPSSQVVAAGGNTTLSVTATGATSYAWKRNGVVLGGVTGNTLNIANATLADRGLYEVVASSAGGSARSLFYLNVAGTNTVTAWGDNSFGQTTIPGGLVNLAQISAGVYHTLALKSDGTVTAWGGNANGQGTVPGGLTNVVAISAGRFHSVALKSNGTVVAWGDNTSGQSTVPGGLNNVVWISAGGSHTLALKNDGTIVAWGDNTYGQCNTPAGLEATVVGLAAGLAHTVALKNDGTVVAWGHNDFGQTTIPAGLTNVMGVDAGASHNVAIKSDGTVVAWGRNDSSQTVVPAGLASVLQVDSLGNHTVALKNDGTVVAWGNNASGQTTVPAGLARVQQVTAGALHSVALVTPLPRITSFSPVRTVLVPGQSLTLSVTATGSGSLTYQWLRNGRPVNGVTGSSLGITAATAQDAGYYLVDITDTNGTTRSKPMFVTVAPAVTQIVAWGDRGGPDFQGLNDVVSVSTGFGYTLGIRRNGTVVARGNNSDGQGTIPPGLDEVVAVAAGQGHSLALRSDGTVMAWGSDSWGRATVPAGLANVVAISANWYHSLALKSDGTVVAWGNNDQGEVSVPAGLTGVIAVETGWESSLALKQDGTIVTWGRFAVASAQPQFSNVVAFGHALGQHFLALKNDGTVVGWGLNNDGQATPPAGLSGVIALGSGDDHSLALKSDGTIVVWGRNVYGQLTLPAGLNSCIALGAAGTYSMALRDATADMPPAVTGRPASQVVAVGGSTSLSIAASGAMSYVWKHNGVTVSAATGNTLNIASATLADRGLYEVVATNTTGSVRSLVYLNVAGTNAVSAWGDNSFGQTTVPGGLANLVQISSGVYHTLALKSDGTVAAWGSNANGQSSVPGGLTGVVAVSAGRFHSVALKADGTVVAWGDNSTGQSSVPGGLNNVVWVSAGGSHTVALKNDGTIVSWGDNTYGQCNTPAGLNALVIGLAAGLSHTVALKNDGTIVSWGRNDFGQTTVPADLSNVVGIDAGASHNIAIKSDGTMVAWGRNDSNQTVLPSGLTTVVQVDSLGNHTLALQTDGRVVAWGNNASGQTTVPAGLVLVQQVAAGALHSVALAPPVTPLPHITNFSPARTVLTPGQSLTLSVTATGSGSLTYQWLRNGRPVNGVTGSSLGITAATAQDAGYYLVDVTDANGTTRSSPFFVLVAPATTRLTFWGRNDLGQGNFPAGVNDIVALSSAGNAHTLAIRRNGTVLAWGVNDLGQTNVPAGLTDVVAVASSNVHSLALKSDGTVVAWGSSQLTAVPPGLHDVVAISAGSFHSLALRSDGTVVQWQDPAAVGQGTVPADLRNAVSVAAGASSSLALKPDGTVVGWGSITTAEILNLSGNVAAIGANGFYTIAVKNDGTLVEGAFRYPSSPSPPSDLSGVVAAAEGGGQGLALKSDGTVVGWGDNAYGEATPPADLADVIALSPGYQCSLVLRNAVASPPLITGQPAAQTMVAGQTATFSVTVVGGGLQYQWRRNGSNLANGSGISGATSATLTITDVQAGATGNYTVVVTNAGGSVTSNVAALTFAVAPTPAVTSLTPVRQRLTPGQNLTLTVTASGDGPLSYQWKHNGRNIPGATSATFPLTNLTYADSGWYQVVITNNLGSVRSKVIFVTVAPAQTNVVAWGDNFSNQTNVPGGLNDAVAVSAGYSTTVAMHADGTLAGWGEATQYQPLPTVTDGFAAIAAGASHYLGLKNDGTVVVWGNAHMVPAGLADVVAIAAGNERSYALKSDGTVVAWDASTGNLLSLTAGLQDVVGISAFWLHALALKSDGTVVPIDGTAPENIPAGLSNVAAIAAGDYFSAALKTDGTVVLWGDRSTWTAVPGSSDLANIKAISIGQVHLLTLKSDGTVKGWGENAQGQISIPVGLTKVFAIAAGNRHSVALRDASSDFPPTVTARPSSQLANAGGNATLSFTTSGATGYIWKHNGMVVAGANSSSLSLTNVTLADRGLYEVTASNGTASVRSLVHLNIASTNTVRAWGDNGAGQTTIPAGLANLAQISAGVYHTLGLKSDGTVAAWGDNAVGQCSVPAGLSNVVVVSAGRFHSVALKGDGTVVAWGLNDVGQSSVPAGLNNVVWISAGGAHTVALKNDGTIVTWGDNTFGQCTVPAGLSSTVVGLSAGLAHTLALKNDGTVVAWGRNDYGQSSIPDGLANLVSIDVGASHNVVIRSDGAVLSWGRNDSGQTLPPAGLANVVQVDSLGNHTLALKSDGSVVAWGNSASGQTAVPAGLGTVQQVAAGALHSVVLVAAAPQPPPFITTQPADQVVTAGQTATFTVVATGSGISYQWRKGTGNLANGGNISGANTATLTIANAQAGDAGAYSVELTNTTAVVDSNPATLTVNASVLPVITGRPASGIFSVGVPVTFSVTATGATSYVWKLNGMVVTGQNTASLNIAYPTVGSRGLYEVDVTNASGSTRVLFYMNVATTNLVGAWGDNTYGQTSVPGGLANLAQISSGVYHTLALKSDGTVVAWGSNANGQCSVPAGLSGVVAVSAGRFHSIALKSDGTVVAWGLNDLGQSSVPAGLGNVVWVSAGGSHTLALKSDGTIVAWGDNTYGQLNTPAGLEATVVGLSAGMSHTLALKNDGTVVAWGRNDFGQTTIPAGLSNVWSIEAGASHNLAVKNDGTVVAWGRNDSNQTVVPAGLSDVLQVDSLGNHTLALKLDGTVMAWGNNASGQVTLPGGLSNVQQVAAGALHSVALIGPVVPAAPSIATRPLSVAVPYYGSFDVTVNATGSGNLTYTWKRNGALLGSGVNNTAVHLTPTDFGDRGIYELVVSNAQGSVRTLFGVNVTGTNTVVAWGDNTYGQTAVPGGLANLTQISSGVYHTLALKGDGTVVAWGSNSYGQCSVPAGLSGVVAVSAGRFHSVALKSDGTVVAWGLNDLGQSSVPAGLNNVILVTAGGSHTLALKNNGTIVSWGDNTFGQRNTPAGVEAAVIGLAAGMNHTIALKNDGTVVAWGLNDLGQSTVPAGLSNVIGIEAGASHNLAIKSDGTVVAWGRNDSNQTVVPAGLANVRQVDSLGNHTLALKSDSRVVAWGNNASGQATVPADIGPIQVQQVAAGALHSVLLVNMGVASGELAPAMKESSSGSGADSDPIKAAGAAQAGGNASGSVAAAGGAAADETGAMQNEVTITGSSLSVSEFGVTVDGATAQKVIMQAVAKDAALPPLLELDAETGTGLSGNFATTPSGTPSKLQAVLTPGRHDVLLTNPNDPHVRGLLQFRLDVAGAAKAPLRITRVTVAAEVGVAGQPLDVQFTVAGTGPHLFVFSGVRLTAGGPALTDPNLLLLDDAGRVVASNNDWWKAADVADLTAVLTAVGSPTSGLDASDAAMLVDLKPGRYTIRLSAVGAGMGLLEFQEVP